MAPFSPPRSPSRSPPRSPDPPDPAPPDRISPPSPHVLSSPINAATTSQSPLATSFDSVAHQLQKSSVPSEIPSAVAPSYAERFKASLRNLRKISSPTFLENGTPVVQASESVLLYTSDLWKDHIIAHFHGSIPPAKKIFDDLNPVWGKFGKITVRIISATSCLIFVPSVQTREWILQVGYWQAAHCALSVFPWSSDANLAPLELTTAPTWVILKNVPPQLYSLDGISVIASGIGEPLHTEHSRLDPYYFGDTKVKVEIDLGTPPPEIIEVRNAVGHSVRIRAQYPRLPPKCCNCGRFGHYLNRCPEPMQKKKHSGYQPLPRTSAEIATVNTKVQLAEEPALETEAPPPASTSPGPSKDTIRRRKSRSRSRARTRARSLDVRVLRTHEVTQEPQYPQSDRVIAEIASSLLQTNSETPKTTDDPVIFVPMGDAQLVPPNACTSGVVASLSEENAMLSQQIDEGNPWYTSISKKNKRLQKQGGLWGPPVDSVTKALRFRGRAQGSSMGKKPHL